MSKLLVLVTLLALLVPVNVAAQSSERHPTCGRISGESRDDVAHLRDFCTNLIENAGEIVSARANSLLLFLDVSREMALAMRQNPLDTEVAVKGWMRIWKLLNDSNVADITVSYQGVDIATGRTTLLSGDRVTVSR